MAATRADARGSRLASLTAFALASAGLLVPCLWQSRIQAGDLGSHSYNAWLAQLIRSGQAPGLRIEFQTTNVLFDLILDAAFAPLGHLAAERIAVALAVLAFAWGAFALVAVVSGRRAFEVLPLIAMLAYGWVFHIGFFNFQLGLGLSLFALALCWNGSSRRIAAALPILALAYTAHVVPVAWAGALIAFVWLWRRAPDRLRPYATLGAIALLAAASAVAAHSFPSRWSPTQAWLASGADQLSVFDRKYDLLAVALFAVFSFALVSGVRAESLRRVASRLELQVFALCAAGVFALPGAILLPGYGHALVFVSERMSLASAVFACAWSASLGLGRARLALALIAVVFFAFLYRDGARLNRFEDRLDELVALLPPGQRVVLGVRDPTLRVNALEHAIDRACIGRCYSYANYEPSTLQFRIRADEPNPIVVSSYAASALLQRGGYRVQSRDLPLFQIALSRDGELGLLPLEAGAITGMAGVEILSGEIGTEKAASPAR